MKKKILLQNLKLFKTAVVKTQAHFWGKSKSLKFSLKKSF